jgi:tRNA(fMet)-specific endonuclease VapC
VGRRAARAARLGRPRRYGPLARLILDTTALIDAERAGAEKLDELIGDEDDVAIAAISVAELAVGAELADGKRRAEREEFVDAVLDAFVIESYDVDVAQAHGTLLAHTRRSGRPRGAHDLIIAATAWARRREVLSADREGFAELPGVKLRKL